MATIKNYLGPPTLLLHTLKPPLALIREKCLSAQNKFGRRPKTPAGAVGRKLPSIKVYVYLHILRYFTSIFTT